MSICTTAEVLAALGLDQPTSTAAQTAWQQQMVGVAGWLQPQVERLIKEHVGYEVEQSHYVEFLPPAGGSSTGGFGGLWRGGYTHQELQLTQLPVRVITSVNENPNAWSSGNPLGDWPSSSLLSPGRDYVLDADANGLSRSGQLLRMRGPWLSFARCVRVEYDAGWTPTELAGVASDFKRAVLVSMAQALNEVRAHMPSPNFQGVGAVQSEGFSGLSVSYARAAENLGLQFALPSAAIRILERRVRLSLF